jgi:hypothetical protein
MTMWNKKFITNLIYYYTTIHIWQRSPLPMFLSTIMHFVERIGFPNFGRLHMSLSNVYPDNLYIRWNLYFVKYNIILA